MRIVCFRGLTTSATSSTWTEVTAARAIWRRLRSVSTFEAQQTTCAVVAALTEIKKTTFLNSSPGRRWPFPRKAHTKCGHCSWSSQIYFFVQCRTYSEAIWITTSGHFSTKKLPEVTQVGTHHVPPFCAYSLLCLYKSFMSVFIRQAYTYRPIHYHFAVLLAIAVNEKRATFCKHCWSYEFCCAEIIAVIFCIVQYMYSNERSDRNVIAAE